MPSSFPGTLRRAKRTRIAREPRANRPQPTTPISLVSAVKTGAVLTITFDQPVSLKGIPQYTTNLAGITPISAAMTLPTVLSMTFSATIAAATTLTIPYEEPAIRNVSGGFVKDSTFPLT